MIAPRRFLPSVNSLLALEAVDRLGTAVAAADDLSLTHSAVSRQLKALEEQMGVAMFVRDRKGLALTAAGVRYAQAARLLLSNLARASMELRASGARDVINLAVLPAFGAAWLTPRLGNFTAAHPGIYVNQRTRLTRFDLAAEGFDAAIHFGAKDWPGVQYLELARERLVPVGARALVPNGAMAAGDLLNLPLLHLESRPGAWEDWFGRMGYHATHLRGAIFDQFSALAAAATAGLGLALLPDYLADREIADGRVVAAHPDRIESGAYYLVWPESPGPGLPLEHLINFLKTSELHTILM